MSFTCIQIRVNTNIRFNTSSTSIGLVLNEAVTIEMLNNGGAGTSVAVSPAKFLSPIAKNGKSSSRRRGARSSLREGPSSRLAPGRAPCKPKKALEIEEYPPTDSSEEEMEEEHQQLLGGEEEDAFASGWSGPEDSDED